jgi:hypothetical protein
MVRCLRIDRSYAGVAQLIRRWQNASLEQTLTYGLWSPFSNQLWLSLGRALAVDVWKRGSDIWTNLAVGVPGGHARRSLRLELASGDIRVTSGRGYLHDKRHSPGGLWCLLPGSPSKGEIRLNDTARARAPATILCTSPQFLRPFQLCRSGGPLGKKKLRAGDAGRKGVNITCRHANNTWNFLDRHQEFPKQWS